jgi:hypothetical protein
MDSSKQNRLHLKCTPELANPRVSLSSGRTPPMIRGPEKDKNQNARRNSSPALPTTLPTCVENNHFRAPSTGENKVATGHLTAADRRYQSSPRHRPQYEDFATQSFSSYLQQEQLLQQMHMFQSGPPVPGYSTTNNTTSLHLSHPLNPPWYLPPQAILPPLQQQRLQNTVSIHSATPSAFACGQVLAEQAIYLPGDPTPYLMVVVDDDNNGPHYNLNQANTEGKHSAWY